MYIVKVETKDNYKFADTYFEDFTKAVQYYKDSVTLGYKCTLTQED